MAELTLTKGVRVRLTTKGGENTVEGKYQGWNHGLYSVNLLGSIAVNSFPSIDWNIEVIEPTALDHVRALKPGAVIHDGREYSALAVKATGGKWYFVYSDDVVTSEVSEESLANFIENHNWEIQYEGHEVGS